MNTEYRKRVIHSLVKEMERKLDDFEMQERASDYLIYRSRRTSGLWAFLLFDIHNKKNSFSVECGLSTKPEFPWSADATQPTEPFGPGGMRFCSFDQTTNLNKRWVLSERDPFSVSPDELLQPEPASLSPEDARKIADLVTQCLEHVRFELLPVLREVELRVASTGH